MVKVITYGTYDLLHYGHIRLLERAKALGDYLIVGVTADDFDKSRGKINVQQTLEERLEAVRATGIADKVIIESYEGQKIDDIKKYGVDIFTVGSDWEGAFDYLKDLCKVIYLPRTEGVSSSEIRAEVAQVRLGMVGYSSFLNKFYAESQFVNAVNIVGICSSDFSRVREVRDAVDIATSDYGKLLENVDAIYVHSHPRYHYEQVKRALLKGKHVLCESPLAYSKEQCSELYDIASQRGCILMEAIRTAYMTAYSRLLLLLKGGRIGKIVSVDATCTSMNIYKNFGEFNEKWGAMEAWGPTALLPVFQILGTNYIKAEFFGLKDAEIPQIDGFTEASIYYKDSIGSIKVGTAVKSEGELIISGTKGYAYVPAPWWKTDYFELRFEDPTKNKRYFYQVDGEGIRYELVELANAIRTGVPSCYIEKNISLAISSSMDMHRKVMESYGIKNYRISTSINRRR